MEMIASHPIADIVPIADPDQCSRLTERIRKHGRLRRPIVLFEDLVLDGRHRQQSCKELGIAPSYEVFRGTYEEAIDFVIDENLARRQIPKDKVVPTILKLTERIAAFSAERQKAGKKIDPNEAFAEAAEESDQTLASREAKVPGKTAEKVAKATGVSRATVERVVSVAKKGTDEVKAAMESGGIAPKTAAKIARNPKPEQNAKLAEATGAKAPDPAPSAAPTDPIVGVIETARSEVRSLLLKLTAIDKQLDACERLPGFDAIPTAATLKQNTGAIREAITEQRPHGVCPSCRGAKCNACKNRGWVTIGAWNGFSEEKRAKVYSAK